MTVQAISPIWPEPEEESKHNSRPTRLVPQTRTANDDEEETLFSGQRMPHGRTRLTDRFHPPSPNCDHDSKSKSLSNTSLALRSNEGTSELLDATLDLLHKMKDLFTHPSPEGTSASTTTRAVEMITSPQETSLLEQLDLLNQLMGFEQEAEDEGHGSLLTLTMMEEEGKDAPQPETTVSRSSFHDELDDDGENENTDPTQPWKELVMELRRQVEAVEYDRAELVRTTGEYWEEQHSMHQYEVEAAAATAFRKGYEEGSRKNKGVGCPICQQPPQETLD